MRRLFLLLLVGCTPPAMVVQPAASPAPVAVESPAAPAPPQPGPPLTSYSLHDGEVVRLDLRNERIEPLAGIPAIADAREISSLALVEDHLIACQVEAAAITTCSWSDSPASASSASSVRAKRSHPTARGSGCGRR